MARLEHVNVTVADPDGTAEMLCRVFGWRRRWQGAAMTTGRTIHVGNDDSYVALFSYGDAVPSKAETYRTRGGLNHIAVVVDDFEGTEHRIRAAGYQPGAHHDYAPGRRFYFTEENGIEIEVVCYGSHRDL